MDDRVLPYELVMTQLTNATGIEPDDATRDLFLPYVAKLRAALNEALRLLSYEFAAPVSEAAFASPGGNETGRLVSNATQEIVSSLVAFIPAAMQTDWLDVTPCLVTHHAVVHVRRQFEQFEDYTTESYKAKVKAAAQVRSALQAKIDAVDPNRTLPAMEKKIVCPKCKSHLFIGEKSVMVRRPDEPSKWIYSCKNEIHGEITFDTSSQLS